MLDDTIAHQKKLLKVVGVMMMLPKLLPMTQS